MGDVQTSGGQNVTPIRSLRDRLIIDRMEDDALWTILGNDTASLAANNNSLLGAKSLSFDKVDGAANTLIAGIDQVLPKVLDLSEYLANDKLSTAFFAAALTNIISVSIRLGTDVSNYSQWNTLVASLTEDVWNHILHDLSDADIANQVGTGHDLSAIAYAAVLVNFTLETNALAGLHFDHLHIQAADN